MIWPAKKISQNDAQEQLTQASLGTVTTLQKAIDNQRKKFNKSNEDQPVGNIEIGLSADLNDVFHVHHETLEPVGEIKTKSRLDITIKAMFSDALPTTSALSDNSEHEPYAIPTQTTQEDTLSAKNNWKIKQTIGNKTIDLHMRHTDYTAKRPINRIIPLADREEQTKNIDIGMSNKQQLKSGLAALDYIKEHADTIATALIQATQPSKEHTQEAEASAPADEVAAPEMQELERNTPEPPINPNDQSPNR